MPANFQPSPGIYERDVIAAQLAQRFDIDAFRNVSAQDKVLADSEGAVRVEREPSSSFLPGVFSKKQRPREQRVQRIAAELIDGQARFLQVVVTPSPEYRLQSGKEIAANRAATAKRLARMNATKRGKRPLRENFELVLTAQHVALLADGRSRDHVHALVLDTSGIPAALALETVVSDFECAGLSVSGGSTPGDRPRVVDSADHVRDLLAYLHGYPVSLYWSELGSEKRSIGEAVVRGAMDPAALAPALEGLLTPSKRMAQCVRYFGAFSSRKSSSKVRKERPDCVPPPAPVPIVCPREPVPREQAPCETPELLATPEELAAEAASVTPRKPRLLTTYTRPHHQFGKIVVTCAVLQWPRDPNLPGKPPTVEEIEAEFPELAEDWRRDRAALAAARIAANKPRVVEVWYPEMAA